MESVALLLGFSIQTVNNWISAGGYVVLFGLLFACGLGLPLPEDIPLIIAGALIAQGKMTWGIAAICAWCGIIGGDIVLYHIARKFGMEITRVPFIGKHVTRERIERVEKLFEKYGVGVVGIGRLFAGIRGAMVICAGAIRYNFIVFIIADGLAAVVSGGFFMILGHWIGTKLLDPGAQKFIHRFKEWFFAGGVIVALCFVLFILWRRRHAQAVIETEAKVVDKIAGAATKIPHPHIGGGKPPPPDRSAPPESAG
jgi:membrane protein DedA with SNARE-associated domain